MVDKKALWESARAMLLGAGALYTVSTQPPKVDACAVCAWNGHYMWCTWIGGGTGSWCSIKANSECGPMGTC
jgi:hypothetical protein